MSDIKHTVVRSATREVVIGSDQPFCLIGERLNPTGRKIFAEQLRRGDLSRIAIDVEHVGATFDLGLDVALDRGQVAGAQLLLEDPPTSWVDPLADQAERAVVPDDDLRTGTAQDGLEVGRGHQAGTLSRLSWSRDLAFFTVAEASAA